MSRSTSSRSASESKSSMSESSVGSSSCESLKPAASWSSERSEGASEGWESIVETVSATEGERARRPFTEAFGRGFWDFWMEWSRLVSRLDLRTTTRGKGSEFVSSKGKKGRGGFASSPRDSVLVEVNEEAEICSLTFVEEVYSLVVHSVLTIVAFVLLYDVNRRSLGGLDLLWRFGLLRFRRRRVRTSNSRGG